MENKDIQQEITVVENTTEAVVDNGSAVEVKGSKILEWVLYILGAFLIINAIMLYFKDLDLRYDGDIYNFNEESYVGGDAYNYIISAARSTAVMVKSLIMAVLGSSAIIVGRLSALINIKKNESK